MPRSKRINHVTITWFRTYFRPTRVPRQRRSRASLPVCSGHPGSWRRRRRAGQSRRHCCLLTSYRRPRPPQRPLSSGQCVPAGSSSSVSFQVAREGHLGIERRNLAVNSLLVQAEKYLQLLECHLEQICWSSCFRSLQIRSDTPPRLWGRPKIWESRF